MQVHTFIEESAREAVERIRAELGPTAVVLSVRKLPRPGLGRFLESERIEVQAGIPEPAPTSDPLAEIRREIRELREQMAEGSPGPNRHERPTKREEDIMRLLCQTGLLPLFAEQIAQEVAAHEPESSPFPVQLQRVKEILRSKWQAPESIPEASVHLFVGVPGCGKSTVLCKMLTQANLAQAQPATVYQLDTHLANSSPQPAVYAEILGAEFERVCPLQFEWSEESVFIDVPGVGLGDAKGLAALQDLLPRFGTPQIHLVLNSAYEAPLLLEQVRFFSALGTIDLIPTHLDEETRWGKMWNLLLGTNFYIRSFSCGQNIPGEFLPALPDHILHRQFSVR